MRKMIIQPKNKNNFFWQFIILMGILAIFTLLYLINTLQ